MSVAATTRITETSFTTPNEEKDEEQLVEALEILIAKFKKEDVGPGTTDNQEHFDLVSGELPTVIDVADNGAVTVHEINGAGDSIFVAKLHRDSNGAIEYSYNSGKGRGVLWAASIIESTVGRWGSNDK